MQNCKYLRRRSSSNNNQITINIFYSVRCRAFYHYFGKPINDIMKKIRETSTATVSFRFKFLVQRKKRKRLALNTYNQLINAWSNKFREHSEVRRQKLSLLFRRTASDRRKLGRALQKKRDDIANLQGYEWKRKSAR